MQIDVEALSVEQLIRLQDQISKQLEARRTKASSDLAQLSLYFDKSRKPLKKRGVKPGTKFAPIYVGPAGETWTGRGKTPCWLRHQLAIGADPIAFRIKEDRV
ncbi:H-NS histone family protein [Variibacter gotjawalensis]|uniref:H-NS histone family protein n=1 Tax=Variibacter gotjawalensis TaxID=1333996 RepID=A0A0S3PXL6_9BRAD|nr:DNA-binding protein H-NS [Variibacter gotjawalensis]RZS48354.1 DNA-binding protein H-NS [Variibacter gotjawalensis]BAT60612.1 H-NS histone family protein [Variibacter gotjawalensis]